jgi:enoyl-CoA hydratase/carnithine racemase
LPVRDATKRALAAEIATRSPSAIRAAKRLIALAESGVGELGILMEESREQAALIGQPDQMEQIAAHMAKPRRSSAGSGRACHRAWDAV